MRGPQSPEPPDGGSYEARQSALDPHRREERDAAAAELAGRLHARGVHLTGRETSEEVSDLLDAVSRFEDAVESRGGDLMVNTPRSSRPEDPDFVIPTRGPRESVADYLVRISQATDRVRTRHHTPRP